MIDKTEQTSDYNVQSFSMHVLLNSLLLFIHIARSISGRGVLIMVRA